MPEASAPARTLVLVFMAGGLGGARPAGTVVRGARQRVLLHKVELVEEMLLADCPCSNLGPGLHRILHVCLVGCPRLCIPRAIRARPKCPES